MTPVWLAFVSGLLVGGAVAIATLGIVLHWHEIIGHRDIKPAKLPLARTLQRVEERRLEVPAVRRRQAIPRVELER